MTPRRRRRDGLRLWLRYRFDETVSRGPWRLLGWMFLITFLVVAGIVGALHASGSIPAVEDGGERGLLSTIWNAILISFAGPSEAEGLGGGKLFIAGMFVVGLIGMAVVWALIGIISEAISDHVEVLRRGRSQVVEHDHTVILGWSPHVPTIVQELTLANLSRGRACIAILADQDKVDMEEAIADRLIDAGRTRVVCRSGSPLDTGDVALVNPFRARAVIVVAPDDVDDPDVHVLKAVLAILRNRRKDDGEGPHIVAEVRDPQHLSVLRMVGRGRVRPVVASELIAQVTVQASRQAGLSLVWTDLLDFEGNELYVHVEPALVGQPFAAALRYFDGALPLGVRDAAGLVRWNPPATTSIAAGDALIVLAVDDALIRPRTGAAAPVDEAAIVAPVEVVRTPERTMIIGWNDAGATVLTQLAELAAPGSSVTVVSAHPAEARSEAPPGTLAVEHRVASTTSREVLEGLGLASYDHVIVLPEHGLSPNDADARSLVTLLHLRDMARTAAAPFNIVSELRDVRNRDLAEESRADDYVVSDRLVSLMLAQAAESADMTVAALLESGEVDLQLRPAEGYVVTGRAVTFETVRVAAERRGELALGYFVHAQREAGRAAVELNPAPASTTTLRLGDQVVVLAGRSRVRAAA